MSFFKNIKEFIHNVTTSDHYAQYDDEGSPNRGNTPIGGRNSSQMSLRNNGSTISLGQNRQSSGNSPYLNNINGSNASTNNNNTAIPYRPGMRSQMNNDSQIELRNYENGQQIRDILEIWDKIDEWLDNEFPELGDDMQGGATANDLNAFESDLGVNLPSSFRDSYQIHDGQVSMGKTRGLIFTYQLMDLESIAAETNIWRRVYERLEKKEAGSNSLGVQKSCPPNFVNEIYYDPLWIPFVKDNVGNNIALDLNPNSQGKWGQIILFGRDYDTKFVIADSFSEFLSNLEIALDNGNYEIDEDEDLVYISNDKSYNYFDVLKSKSIQRAKKLDEHFRLVEKKTNDADLFIKKQRTDLNRSMNSGINIRQSSQEKQKVPSNVSENLPRETLISPVYPQAKRDLTPSKENIAATDSFVIDEDEDAGENADAEVEEAGEVLISEDKEEPKEEVEIPVKEIEELKVEEPAKEEETEAEVEVEVESEAEAETESAPEATPEPETEDAEEGEQGENAEEADESAAADSTAATGAKKSKNKKKNNKKKGKK